MGPILILVALLAGALFFARQIAQSQSEEEDKPKVVDNRRKPFADLPEDAPARLSTGSSSDTPAQPTKSYPPAPTGIVATNDVWLKALKDATEAETLFAKAQDAKAANDHEGFRENGIAAKKLFSKVLEDTALLEEELRAEYGDSDAQILQMIKKRNAWTDRLQILSKTTGR